MTTRTLVLVRHAHAVPHASGGDRARPLSAAGLDQARALGRTLSGVLPGVDEAVCSTAVRTVQTLEALADSIDVASRWRDDALYLCDADDLLADARAFDDDVRVAMLVAHEPSISWAAGLLASDGPSAALVAMGVPTATAVVARFAGRWRDLTEGGCSLETYHESRRS